MMPYLIAQGPQPTQRWRRRLESGSPQWLGRSSSGWSVPWDEQISRRHATLKWDDHRLHVARCEHAANPIFFRGNARDEFWVLPGEHFVIGQTSFFVSDDDVGVTEDAPPPVTERGFPADQLKQHRYRNAVDRIEALNRLPEILASATTDSELYVRLVNLLLSATPHASFAAIVRHEMGDDGQWTVRILQWDGRGESPRPAAPSARLVHQAVTREESVVHLWGDQSPAEEMPFTQHASVDWAFCTPIVGRVGAGRAIYLAGKALPGFGVDFQDPEDLQDDLKFTELAASTVARVWDLRALERRQTALSQFLSPVVLARMADHEPDEVLAPREADVSVLFCDLRGFSRQSEQHADDLMGLLRRVSHALGVMTRHILFEGGVIGDFHGDAAMGFWGWPLDQEDMVARACRAALAIRAEFMSAAQHRHGDLSGFRMGIGLATGRAVAGKIGTTDQVKVTVFGPVVNLAARLESLTKVLQAPILLDEATARAARLSVPRETARVRRLARLRPPGMDQPCEVSELLPPVSQYPELTDEHLAAYESALDAFIGGDWQAALKRLHDVPVTDEAKDFLTGLIAQHHRQAPPDWNGVIEIAKHLE